MIVEVLHLGTQEQLFFCSKTPYQAMQSLIYTLNLKRQDKTARVNLLGGGRTLSVEHCGETYSCLNRV